MARRSSGARRRARRLRDAPRSRQAPARGRRGYFFARLNEYSLAPPPLRERKEDIYALCRALLARHNAPGRELTFPFMTGLLHYDYPFNVRELEAFIKRGIALSDGGPLDAQHLPDEIKTLMKSYGRPTTSDANMPRADHRRVKRARELAAPDERREFERLDRHVRRGPRSARRAQRGRAARAARAAPRERGRRGARARQGTNAYSPLDEALRYTARRLPLSLPSNGF